MINASAPGKAVLSGEFAVLRDAAAIAVAVNRRARVTVSNSADEDHCISAPGYLQGQWTFALGRNGEFVWHGEAPAPGAFSLVETAWHCFGAVDWPPLSTVIDTRELCDADTGQKFGLGSSAAVAVAVTAALKKFAAIECDCRGLAFDAHARFQDGRGSGVDVATSHDGGLILYRRDGRKSRRLDWPRGLHYRCLWSGQVAATAGRIAVLSDSIARGTQGATFDRLAAQAENVAVAWTLGDAQGVLESYPAYIEAMQRFDRDHDLGIFSAGHAELVHLATGNDVIYKPCGAGGGDIGIVLGACEHDVNEFCEQAGRRKFTVLDLDVDEQGILFAE